MSRMLNRTAIYFSRYHQISLVLIWFLMQFFLYQHFDIRIVFDSRRYLYIVDQVLSGTYQAEGNLSYFSYILFIAAFLKAGLSLKTVILGQVLVSGFAAVCVYRIAEKLALSRTAGFCASLLFIGWPDLQCWNFYIHTESVFVSLSIFILYLLLQPYKFRNLYFLLSLLLIILFIRPYGFMVWLAVAAFFITRFIQINPAKGRLFLKVSLVLGLPLFAWLANAILYNIRNIFSFTKYFENGEILQGYTGWILKPGSPFKTPPEGEPIVMLFDLFRLNGWYIPELMGLRLAIFYGQVRPYYTFAHNLIVVLYMFPVYVLAGYTLLFQRNMAAAKAYIITLLIVQTGITLLSAVDWDNRFMVPLLPFIFILAGIAAGRFSDQKLRLSKADSAAL